jgi:YHS domain-containing protein
MVAEILVRFQKDTGARVLYDHDPQHLVTALLGAYRAEHFRHPSVFCRGAGDQISDDEVSDDDAAGEIDVICKMQVPAGAAAARRTRNGKRFVFCSLQCAEQFDADPHRY